jgi:uncharacterized protein (DUF1015 family)
MNLIQPFAALRPAPGRANDVVAPPYDVLSTEEARLRVQGRPWSFLHISKPEIDLPPGTDPYAPEVYAKAAENLRNMIQAGVLVRDPAPSYYAYRIIMGEHVQTGLVAAASVVDYDSNRIRKHEFTRPDKEDDRVRQIDALDAQTGPVLLAYPDAPQVDAILAAASAGEPDSDAELDGVRHTLWAIRDAANLTRITAAFDAMPALYIADGHHRSASASRIAASRRAANPQHRGDESYNFFLSVIFPAHQMRILDYNRVIADLNGLAAESLIERIGSAFSVEAAERSGEARASWGVRPIPRRTLVSPGDSPRTDPDRPGGQARRQPAAEQPDCPDPRHHRPTTRQAHRLRRRHPRSRRTGKARQQRRDGVGAVAPPDPHGRPDGGRRCQRGDAAQIHLVRAEAG